MSESEGMTHEKALALHEELREPPTPTEEALLDILCVIWRVLKAADSDLEAHKNAIKALLLKHPEVAESLDGYLAHQRQQPSLRESMNQKYARLLGTTLQKLPDSLREKALARMGEI